MSHVDGSDDGVGYGVFGESNSGGLGVKGHSQISSWCGWEQPRRLWCEWI